MANSGQVNDDPRTTAQLAAILEDRWDIGSAVKAGHSAGGDFYREQAVIVSAMLSAGARETEVQRYLRQLEQKVLPVTLHSAEARHAIAVALWRVARGLDPDPAQPEA
jgi:hypothetical protein